MVLYVEIIHYNSTNEIKSRFFLYEFTGPNPFREEALLVYSTLNDNEVQLQIKNPEAYYRTAETRIYPKHSQYTRALIHFLLNSTWPDPKTTLTTVYDFPKFNAVDRFNFQNEL